VDPLDVGAFDAFSPYCFLHRSNYDWHPSAEQIAEARKLVRPFAAQPFVEQRKDTRLPLEFTYVRRPGYYAAFFAVPKPRSVQQRPGLTFVWTPRDGVLLQSQTDGTDTAWGTLTGGAAPVERAGEIVERLPVFDPRRVTSTAQIAVRQQESSPVPGKRFSVVELTAHGKLEYEISAG